MMPFVGTIAHADWSIGAKKRWITIAHRDALDMPWRIEAPQRLDAYLGKGAATHTLHDRLWQPDRHTLIGLDLPLGVPALIAEKTALTSWRELLERLETPAPPWHEFLTPCTTKEQISMHRPFYPHTPKGSRRAHLVDGLDAGEWESLLRECDRPEPGGAKPCPLFWTVGANQVGKAAITGWRELLLPLLHHPAVKLWPFDESMEALTQDSTPSTIFAEVYPAEVYTWLELDWGKSGKRAREGRQKQSDKILKYLNKNKTTTSEHLRDLIEDGFGEGARGEDPFDSLVGCLGMLHILSGQRALFEPAMHSTTRDVEGWIFGRHPLTQRTDS